MSGVTWQAYSMLLDAIGDRAGVRVTYDRGELEIYMPSTRHECLKDMAARLAEQVALETRTRFRSFGSATWRREGLDRGAEPDDCFCFRHLDLLRGRTDVGTRPDDPPPDLAVEVDIGSSSLPKLPIYAALRVPEVWRLTEPATGVAAEILACDDAGVYRPVERSAFLPVLTPPRIAEFVRVHDASGDALDAVDWLRRTLPTWT